MEPDPNQPHPHYPGIGRYDDPGEDDNQHQQGYSVGNRRDRDMYLDSHGHDGSSQPQASPNKRRRTDPLLGVHGEPIPYQPTYFGTSDVQEKSQSQSQHQISTSSSYQYPLQRENLNFPMTPVLTFSPLPLLHPSQHPPGMSNADVLTCQNVELFQRDTRTYEHDTSAGSGDIGIRCIHCARTDVTVDSDNSIFIPSSIEMIDSGLRMMAKSHFLKCVMLPENIREEFHTHEMHRRLDAHDHDERRRRQDMNYRKSLSDYCVDICHRVNIINRHPLQTGIIIGTAMVTGISSLRTPGTSPRTNTSREGDRPQIQMGLDQDRSRSTWSPNTMQHDSTSTTHLSDSFQPRRTSDTNLNAPHSPSRSRARGNLNLNLNPHHSSSSSYRQRQRASPSSSSFDSISNPNPNSADAHFPFIQTAENVWECKYCSNLPIGHRAERHAWYSSSSPDRGFMETHLRNCQGRARGINQSSSSSGGNSLSGNTPYQPQAQSTSRSSYNSSNQYSSMPPSTSRGNNPYGNQGQNWNQYNSSKVSNRHMNIPNQQSQSQWRQQSHYSNPMSSSSGSSQNAWNIPTQRDHSFHHQQQSSFGHGQPSRHNPPQQNYPFSYNQDPSMHPAATGMGFPPGPGTSTHQNPPFNASAKEDFEAAMALLKDAEKTFAKSSDGPENGTLVEESDKYLITDYFYHVMRQLRICRFKEGDRTTRGGKRDNIALGYGGLECVHCSNTSNARKFFWSNVDRLSNSFSEIPGHVLKCKACPSSTKDALLELKKCHPAQMTERPRGSQKTFLRRVWRRLHEETDREQGQHPDELLPNDSIVSLGSESPNRPGIKQVAQSVEEAAKALVADAGDPDFGVRVLLAIEEDKKFGLANLDCLVRQNIELFRASEEQVKAYNTEKEKGESISVGQVGIRCIHCSSSDQHDTYHSYPPSLDDLFTAVRAFKSKHLLSCPCFPRAQKDKFESLKESSSSSFGSIVRTYYLDSAQALGLRDDKSGGIKATGKSKPIKSGQSANRR